MRTFEFTDFANRLRKRDKHFSKWARRQGISCFRIYDMDLPRFPFQIDRYADAVYIAEFEKKSEDEPLEDDMQERMWRGALRGEIAEVLNVSEDLIFFKKRKRQSGKSQYEKLNTAKNERIVEENGHKFIINLTDYLDTGLFLDHRQTRKRAQEYADGKDCLNLFAYTGAFSVYMAAGGAKSTTTIDLSNTYTAWAERNMALNGFEGAKHRFLARDVIRCLEIIKPQHFDLVILDPPTFSNSKKMGGILDIQRDHAWMIRQVLKGLRPDGILLFSTNFKKFKFNQDNFKATSCKEITKQTLPPDFQAGQLHRCWEIRK